MKNYPKVSIVIVNYKGFEDTIGCLESISGLDYPNFNVIVVENNSPNESFKELKNYIEKNQKFSIKLIKSKENLGFAGGCNLSIKEARKLNTDYFLLLNPDTKVEPDFLKKLIEVVVKPEIIANKKLGFLGPRIFYENKETTYSNGGLLNKFLTRGILKDHGKNKKELKEKKPFVTDYVTGTALLVSKEVVTDIGLMREDYFLYYEEADWAIRAKKRGYSHFIIPDSIIYHKGYHSTTYLSFNYIYYLIRNGYYLAWWNGNILQKVFVIFYSLYKFIKQFPKLFIPSKMKWARPIWRASWDFWRGKTGKLC